MVVKMKPDDALDYRNALEPLTLKMTSDGSRGNEETIPFASIAISMRRIADSLERMANMQETYR